MTSLNLADNDLLNKTGTELKLAFEAIQPTIVSLDLSCNQLERKTSAELAEALASIPESVTSVKLGWENRLEEASLAIDRLSKHVKNNNGKNDAEEILRVLAPDELKSLHSIYFKEVKNLMTTCRGLYNPLSEMVSTSKKGSQA